MSGGGIPLLWLCGPSGVGKSAVGWEIFGQLHRAGFAAAYLDADQVGLCHPAPVGDPDNHRVKARGLGAVWPVFRAAGARCLIFSGSVERRDVVRDYAEQVPGTTLTLCRLRVDPDELRARFVRRGWMTELVEEAVREAEVADQADLTDLCVDTGGLGVAAVARLVRERAGRWPGLAGPPGGSGAGRPRGRTRATGTGDVPVLWLCGPVGVGKSAVGWEIYTQVVRGGIAAGYVDLGQLGFCQPAPGDDPHQHRVRAAGLRALWPVYRAAGARCLVVTGRVDDPDGVRAYTGAVPDGAWTVCRLRADRDHLTERILRRGSGEGPPLPGDELVGQPTAVLHQIAEQAARDGGHLDRAGVGDLHVDTDGQTVEQVAHQIRTHAGGWPHLR